ncbi:hypothetical protein U0070_004478, partial [Myodes glareolus]
LPTFRKTRTSLKGKQRPDSTLFQPRLKRGLFPRVGGGLPGVAPDSQFQWEPEKEQGIRVGHQKAGKGEGDHAEPRKKRTSDRRLGGVRAGRTRRPEWARRRCRDADGAGSEQQPENTSLNFLSGFPKSPPADIMEPDEEPPPPQRTDLFQSAAALTG